MAARSKCLPKIGDDDKKSFRVTCAQHTADSSWVLHEFSGLDVSYASCVASESWLFAELTTSRQFWCMQLTQIRTERLPCHVSEKAAW